MAGLTLFAFAANVQTAERSAADAAQVDRTLWGTAVAQFVDDRILGSPRYGRTTAMRPVSEERDHIRGNPAAPVTLVEYSDFECPFCKRFHQTVKQIVDESGGQVRWVYRHFPICSPPGTRLRLPRSSGSLPR